MQPTAEEMERDSLLGEILALTARIDRQVEEGRWDGVSDMIRGRQRAMELLFARLQRGGALNAAERDSLRAVLASMQHNLECAGLARDAAASGLRRHRAGQSAVAAYAVG